MNAKVAFWCLALLFLCVFDVLLIEFPARYVVVMALLGLTFRFLELKIYSVCYRMEIKMRVDVSYTFGVCLLITEHFCDGLY